MVDGTSNEKVIRPRLRLPQDYIDFIAELGDGDLTTGVYKLIDFTCSGGLNEYNILNEENTALKTELLALRQENEKLQKTLFDLINKVKEQDGDKEEKQEEDVQAQQEVTWQEQEAEQEAQPEAELIETQQEYEQPEHEQEEQQENEITEEIIQPIALPTLADKIEAEEQQQSIQEQQQAQAETHPQDVVSMIETIYKDVPEGILKNVLINTCLMFYNPDTGKWREYIPITEVEFGDSSEIFDKLLGAGLVELVIIDRINCIQNPLITLMQIKMK